MNPDNVIFGVRLTFRNGRVETRLFPNEYLAAVWLDSIPYQQANGDLLDVASARLERTGIGLN